MSLVNGMALGFIMTPKIMAKRESNRWVIMGTSGTAKATVPVFDDDAERLAKRIAALLELSQGVEIERLDKLVKKYRLELV